MSIETPSKQSLGPVEYFRAKLEHEITPDGLKRLLDKTPHNVLVVDVREAERYASGHIPEARSVPLDSLVSVYSSLEKDKLIVAYCGDAACALATRAALELAQKGFRVQQLTGGIEEWELRGYPLETLPPEAPSQAW